MNEIKNEQPTLTEAIEKYRLAAGHKFIPPKKSLCKYEKSAWIIFDKKNTLVCIVGDRGPVFADHLNDALRAVALSHVKK